VIMWRSRFGHQQGRADADYWRSIRDAIAEASAKLGSDSRFLRAAVQNVNRAVLWYNLPPDLTIPVVEPEPLPPPPPLVRFLKYMLFI